MIKDTIWTVVSIILLVVILFGATTAGIMWYRHFGIMRENATTDIYRENKSYVEGTVRDLRDLHVQYVQANESQKETLGHLILHRANELDWDRLPTDVREFLNELKEN